MEFRKLEALMLVFLAVYITEASAMLRLASRFQHRPTNAFKGITIAPAKKFIPSSFLRFFSLVKEKDEKGELVIQTFRKLGLYLPVLFSSACRGADYLGSDLDFSLARKNFRLHYIIIQPDLQRSWVFDRDLQKSFSNNLADVGLPLEVFNMFSKLTKNNPGYYEALEFDITKQIYERKPVSFDVISMLSQIKDPQFFTNTFVHPDAVRVLQEKFPLVIVHDYDRCIVGSRAF